ncbi:MAG: tocopherol cyclase family protein [Spirochaetia bacterium]
MKLYNPAVFQGSLRKNRYFEGWYLKHVTADGSDSLALIPGISLDRRPGEDRSCSFIQVIHGAEGRTWWLEYPDSEFSLSRRSFEIGVGDSRFGLDGLSVTASGAGIEIAGELRYSNPVEYPVTLLSPGIMGPYRFVPFMECYHGVVSVDHQLEGSIALNGRTIDFSGGRGYIEKDWGSSFPEAWIWAQCNTFSRGDGASFMFSLAKIPWMGRYFLGFLCFFYENGTFHRFTTYTKAGISRIDYDGRRLAARIRGGKGEEGCELVFEAVKRRFGDLKAPNRGGMSRTIKESVDSDISVRLSGPGGTVLFEDTGSRAGLEVIEEIFAYLPEDISAK